MIMRHLRMATVYVVSILFALLAGNPAQAQNDPFQVLDRVFVTGRDFALNINANDPDRTEDFLVLLGGNKLGGANFVDCAISVTEGIFCLDGKNVVNYPNINIAVSSTIFNCENPALELDAKKDDTCTALARNSQKEIFLGGKQNGNSNLVGIIRAATGSESDNMECSDGYNFFTDNGNALCFAVVATGRPLIQDIDVIEGDLADEFSAGESVLLVLEERKTLLLYSNLDPTVVTVANVIADGKREWNLSGNEQLLNATLLPHAGSFYALASTTNGRILAVDTSGPPSGFEVFDLTANRVDAGGSPVSACPSGNESFDVTVSEKTGFIYTTDGLTCLVHVLRPVADSTNPFVLEIVQEGPMGLMTNLTLSTDDAGGQGTFPPLLVAVVPGISVELSQCSDSSGCTPVIAPNGEPGLDLREVDLGDSVETSMTLFQLTGYPDCRWIPLTCAELLDPGFGGDDEAAVVFLKNQGVIIDVDPAALAGPANQLLNLETLLPTEIKSLFPEGLPPLLMEREVRGAAQNGYFFDAFFGVSPDGLFFEDSYELEINVQALLSGSGTGNALGCFLNLPENSPLYNDGSPKGTLNWDVVAKVSERYTTYTSDTGFMTNTGNRRPYAVAGQPNYETRIINYDCTNPPRSRDGGWSMVPYGLEITPCTAMRNEDDSAWITEGMCDIGDVAFDEDNADPAVLAKLLLKEYKDFRDALNELACVANEDIDGAGSLPPIDGSTCSTANDVWVSGLDKLVKGLEATLEPKTSQGNENLGAFESKLTQLLEIIENYMPPDANMRPDNANRVGDLEARLLTISHIYEDRFLASITETGFGGDAGWVH